VDQKPPKGFGEYRRNVKAMQMQEDRYAQIEHENRLLLSKMSDIMQKGSIDNVSEAWQYGHSLNRLNRKKELQRITEANQHILRRIQGVTPYYNHWEWEEEAIKAEKLAAQLSVFKPRASVRSSGARGSSPSRAGSQGVGAGAGGGGFGQQSMLGGQGSVDYSQIMGSNTDQMMMRFPAFNVPPPAMGGPGTMTPGMMMAGGGGGYGAPPQGSYSLQAAGAYPLPPSQQSAYPSMPKPQTQQQQW